MKSSLFCIFLNFGVFIGTVYFGVEILIES